LFCHQDGIPIELKEQLGIRIKQPLAEPEASDDESQLSKAKTTATVGARGQKLVQVLEKAVNALAKSKSWPF
jgi:hypothetical protein